MQFKLPDIVQEAGSPMSPSPSAQAWGGAGARIRGKEWKHRPRVDSLGDGAGEASLPLPLPLTGSALGPAAGDAGNAGNVQTSMGAATGVVLGGGGAGRYHIQKSKALVLHRGF